MIKQQVQKQFVGVWLDNRHATIITNSSEVNGEYSVLEKVQASVSQAAGSEHTMTIRKKLNS